MLFQDWAALWFTARTVRPTTAASDLGRYNNHLNDSGHGKLPGGGHEFCPVAAMRTAR